MPFRLPGLLAKQAHGLIGQHAAGNRNRREGRFCGDLGAGNHDLVDLGPQLVDRCRIDQAAEMAPDDRAHAPRDLIDVFPRDDAGSASLTSIAMRVALNSSTNSYGTIRTTSPM